MPPWVPYLMALSAYVAAAGAVWIICVLLAPSADWPPGPTLATSMPAFPESSSSRSSRSPSAWPCCSSTGAVFRLLGPDSARPTASCAAGLLDMILFAAASLCGFYAGWSVAWRVSGGADLSSTLRTHPLVGEIGSFPGRVSSQLRYICAPRTTEHSVADEQAPCVISSVSVFRPRRRAA